MPAGEKIRTISESGLTYIDQNSNEQFIDFQKCYNSYLSQPGYIAPDDWKEIGVRDIFAAPPYIEFYTTPPTTFYFETPEELKFIQIAIWLAGEWQTFDRG